MPIPFVKYSGCGNDFILINNRTQKFSFSASSIQRLCHRQLGIGADGLIFLETPTVSEAHYKMRIFNADGSEAEMCGNGLRCLAQFIRSLESVPEQFTIETQQQLMKISFHKEDVKVAMPPPTQISPKRLIINNQEQLWYCIDTGVPHAVHFVDDIDNEELITFAPRVRFHKTFHPKGTNVNFAKILPDQSVVIRTYERGVEQETLACGTGAVATAIVSAVVHNLKPPINILTKSGDYLSINFNITSFHLSEYRIENLEMTGPAIKIFEGITNLIL